MIDYNAILNAELQGVYGDFLERINQIIGYYNIYDGSQTWDTPEGLDYSPTKKITNLTKKLINTRSRFMFGKEPYFNIKSIQPDSKGTTTFRDQAQIKEDLLYKILKANKFHSKLLKARKDCSIGGKIAIKLWAQKDQGLKIIFSPALEFFPQYNLDDVDQLEKVVFLYALNDEDETANQRIKKQVWEMNGSKCLLNESTHDGSGKLISIEYTDHNTQLDFIPVIIIQNGGLTGEVEGVSDVAELWQNQDAYNKLTSDDIDALKFQMFGQDVVTDADENSLVNLKISPGALIDLQSDQTQANAGRQATMTRLESGFSYKEKFEDTVNRIKNDMHDALGVPNVGLEQLKGLMQSGKSMKALYWELRSVCEEDWTEWGPNLEQMIDYIFRMVDVYDLYKSRSIVKFETITHIEHYYPIQEDEDVQKDIGMQEVINQVRTRKSYMAQWGEYEDLDGELEQIQLEQQMFQDSYTQALANDVTGGGDNEE